MTDAAKLGSAISDACIAAGMTQRELAQKTGITQAAISRYIHGGRIPKVSTLEIIASALNKAPSDLLIAANRKEEQRRTCQTVDMSEYSEFDDETLEEYLNKQGCTLGEDAERLQKLKNCIVYCWMNNVLTDAQCQSANQKFIKQFKAAISEIPEAE